MHLCCIALSFAGHEDVSGSLDTDRLYNRILELLHLEPPWLGRPPLLAFFAGRARLLLDYDRIVLGELLIGFRVLLLTKDPSKWLKQLQGLGYRFKNHDGDAGALCVAAGSAIRSPIFRTTVDVTLAVRKALRRYLGIEPVLTKPEIEKSR